MHIGSVNFVSSEAAHDEYGDVMKPLMAKIATLNYRLTPLMYSQVANCYRISNKRTLLDTLKFISGAYPWGCERVQPPPKKLSQIP